MKRREFLRLAGAGVAAGLVPLGARDGAAQPVHRLVRQRDRRLVERWSWAMGQPVHLQLYAESDDLGYEAAAAALAELRRIESRLSIFEDVSDLAELNRSAGRHALRVGPDLAAVLEAAERARRSSAGAFDPAVEPLMRAWGFHGARSTAPSAAELGEARRAVRAAQVTIQGDRVRLAGTASRLDLGGIGVGYGLDRAAAVLRRAGVRRALLDVSGDCIAIGAPPGEAGWEVAIARPRAPSRLLAVTRLRDAALATSSNLVSVVRYGRAVRGHVMDPERGVPADALVQATAVATSGVVADALSTAMLVSGRVPDGLLRAYRV
ncbi:MAG: FAD:protein FMN transferase [Gemmatimonadales bacterium]|nr:FAD:protein FMN transferase [Gemmatimonadales bacterium]